MLPSWRTLVIWLAGAGGLLAAGWASHWFGLAVFPATDVPGGIRVQKDSPAVLNHAEREYLWQVEHHALILSKYWLHDLADALVQADATALAGMLAADFAGKTFAAAKEERLDRDFVQVVRRQGEPSQALDRDAFATYLLEFRKQFGKPPRAKAYAKSLAPKSRDDLDSPWEGAGVLRLWGEQEAGKPYEAVLHFAFEVPRPARNHLPGWLKACSVTQTQVAGADRFFLRDVTRQRQIDPDLFHNNWNSSRKHGVSGGVYVCDFNRDGFLDILITDIKRIALYQGMPGNKFREVTADMGLPLISNPAAGSHVAAFVDLDGDGWDDLLLGGQVFRNEQGQGFADYTNRTNLAFPELASGVAVADYDKDGKLDLYVFRAGERKGDSWLHGRSAKYGGGRLLHNLGNWKFKDVTAESHSGAGTRSIFTAVWLDANGDGWPDLYVPNEFGNGVLLVNNADGTFKEHHIMSGPQDFGTMGMTCGDINNDGRPDLYLANMYSKTGKRIVGNLSPKSYPEPIMASMRRFVAGSQLYLNRGGLRFEAVGESWQLHDVGWAYGPALVDLDNDGYLDLFASSGFITADPKEPDG